MMKLDRNDGPDCPRCGCQDVAVIRRPSAGGWMSGHGRAQCRACGLTFPILSQQPAIESGMPEVNDVDAFVDHHEPLIQATRYQILLCPECESERVRVTSTTRPKRQHKCKDCGATFQTIEERVKATQ